MTSPSSPSVPPIRSFQFDQSAVGGVQNNVNLFRGDVNLQQPLFTMPGRSSGGGMDVEVSLLYQSNVYGQAMAFNRSSATGVVGLGWSLPGNYIELEGGAGSSPARRSYTLVSSGGQNPLVREPDQPFLFSLTAAEAGSPRAGAAVSAALVAAFGQRGLLLDATATLAAAASSAPAGSLVVDDASNQRQFLLEPGSDGGWDAYDGGESYQLQQYQFWKIIYYPTWERWAITDDTGVVSSYGGRTPDGPNHVAASVGESIEWAVAWGSKEGRAQWVGASSNPSGQLQVARAWHLASKTNLWGEQVSYAYNEQWTADSSTGVKPVVEQLVCAGGKPFTKACYLTGITDVYGRRAVFHYADKLWSSEAGAPREYDDPHRPVPSDDANGWQDRYETQYLESIEIQDQSGGRLFGVALEYQPRPGNGSASAVANVNPSPGDGDAGDYFKRYLTAITISNEFGAAKPPIELSYYLDDSQAQGYSPGALETLTSPSGGVSRWRYTPQLLELCDRTLDVTPPASFGDTAAPRVWFGSDYAVSMWFDRLGGGVALAIHTWQGRWDTWTPSWGSILATEAGGVELSSLAVIPGANFVAISYVTGNTRKLYLFEKDPSAVGDWLPGTVDGHATGADAPCCTYDQSYGPAELSGGETFLLVSYSSGLQAYAYDRLTWRWTTRAWTRETTPLAQLSKFATGADYYLTLAYDRSYRLDHLDADLSWGAGGTGDLSAHITDVTKAALVPGNALVVVAQQYSSGATSQQYGLIAIAWDSDLASTETYLSGTDSTQISWTPTLVDDTMIAVGGRIWRFDGASWIVNDALVISSPTSGWTQRYAYGPDYAIQLYANAHEQIGAGDARLLAFDASAPSSGFGDAKPVHSGESFGTTDAWPSAGAGDFLTMGPYLYYRGSAADWADVITAGQAQDLRELIADGLVLDTDSTVNQGPEFIAFNSKDAATGTLARVSAMILDDDVALAATDISTAVRMVSATDPNYGEPGVSAAGPDTLVTFASGATSFDDVEAFSLYRYAGNDLSGKIQHYNVSSFETDDGFGATTSTAIVADPSTAACDPSGTSIKYYQSVVAPGSASLTIDPGTGLPAPAATPYGFVVVNYINGTEQGGSGEPTSSMLDGMLLSLASYEAVAVSGPRPEPTSRVTLSWESYDRVAARADDPSLPSRLLAGAFAVQAGGTLVKDGVTSSRSACYVAEGFDAPFSTQAVSSASSGVGPSGELEVRGTRSLFASQLDDACTQGVFRALNVVASVIQTQTTWQRGTDAALTTASSATSWSSWPSSLGQGVMVPAKQASWSWLGDPGTLAFPFSGAAPGPEVAGWRRHSSLVTRTVHGLGSEATDAMGVPSSVLFDGSGSWPVASSSNASLSAGEWTYQGFEDYEARDGWTLAGTAAVRGDAYFGSQSVELASGARVSTTVNVRAGVRGYVLGFAVKTPAGFSPASAPTWTLSYGGGGSSRPPAPTTITDSGGTWDFRSIGAIFDEGQAPETITVELTNADAQAILIDAVYLAPLGSTLAAQSFDTRFNRMTGAMVGTGFVTRSLYDDFGAALGTVDGAGVLRQIGGAAQSRAATAGGSFDAAAPNCNLKLIPAGEGVCDDFVHGDEWSTRWASGAQPWTRSPGLLSAGDGGGSLSWKGWSQPPPTAALCLGIRQADGAPSGTISLGFCAGYSISWTAKQGFVASGPGGWAPQAFVQPPVLAGDWALVFGDGILALFAGAQLIFSCPWTEGVPDDLSLSTTGALDLRYLSLSPRPRVSVSYADGNGVARQGQSLDGADAAVSASIYDPLGRKVASTKHAPASFNKAPGDPPILAYVEGFVDRQAFLAAMSDTWELSGTVADYYRGQTIDGYATADCQGYPYAGTRHEARPRGRKLEVGLPGLETAIHDVSQPPASRQTTWYDYGANSALTGVAAGSYYEQTATGPLGNATRRLQDFSQTQVAAELLDPTSEVQAKTRSLQGWTERDSLVVGESQAFTPAHFAADPPAGFVNTSIDDALGQTVATQTPELDWTWAVRDPVGRIRAAGVEGQDWIAYFVYDDVGRPVEVGVLADSLATVAQQVADPRWPLSDPSRRPTREYAYDGDGSRPSALGLRTEVTTITAAPANVDATATPVTVVESYVYDRRGRVESFTQSLPNESEVPDAVFGYSYDNVDAIVEVRYPEGAPLDAVHYGYDDAGRVITIGRSPGATDLGAYTYAINGDLITEVLGAGVLTSTPTFGPQGWLQSGSATLAGVKTPFWSQSFTYHPDSTVDTRTERSAAPLSVATTQLSCTYDGRKQLQSATASGDDPWQETITSCDLNGNILTAELDGSTVEVTPDPSSNRMSSLRVGDGPARAAGYDATGHLTTLGDDTIDYDQVLLLPSGFANADGVSAQLAYGNGGQRVLKKVKGGASSTRAYFGGLSSRPLVLWQDDSWTALVQGPTGLIAAVSELTCFAVKDNLQSIRHLVSEKAEVVASFDYSAFGTIVSSSGAVPGVMPLRFMGQELDAETGFYNFQARLYDPLLRRFHGPDPMHQYPSPYVFVGNQPITNTDPTGEMSWLGLMGMSVIFGVGMALSLATGGASAEAAADVDLLLAGAEATEASVELTETSAEVGEGLGEGLVDAAGEGSEGADVVEAGPKQAPAEDPVGEGSGNNAPLDDEAEGKGKGESKDDAKKKGGRRVGKRNAKMAARHIGVSTASGAVTGGAENGALYLLTNRGSFDLGDFAKTFALGMLEGAISGSMASLVNMPLSKGLMRKFVTQSGALQSLMIIAGKGVVGMGTSDLNYLLTDAVQGKQPSLLGLVGEAAWGGISSASSSALSEGFGHVWARSNTQAKIVMVSLGAAAVVGAESTMAQKAVDQWLGS